MKHIQKGSSVLFIVLIVSALMLWATSALRTTAFTADIAYQREAYEQKMQATSGIMNYGIALCKKNFDELIKQVKQHPAITIPTGDWLVSHQQCASTLVITGDAQSLQLNATLYNENKKLLLQITCTITRLDNNKTTIMVSNWNESTDAK